MSEEKHDHKIEATRPGARAMHWGVMTWVGNAAGCLVGMVPIALPLSVVLTIVTLLTGVWAMVLGVRARRQAHDEEDARHASFGLWLGAAHVVIVVVLAALIALGIHQGFFSSLGIFATHDE